MNNSFRLTALGLKNSILNPQMNNENEIFTFLIGERQFRLHQFLADFLSPKIAKLHLNDPTLNSYIISKNDDENYQELFNTKIINELRQLSHGEEIEIKQDNADNLRIISIMLENTELYEMIDKIMPFKNFNSYLSFIKKAKKFECIPFNNDQIINTIANSFYSINPEELIKLPEEILLSIISSPDLKLENEDSLYQIINNFINLHKNDKNINETLFYEQINFMVLSESNLIDFITRIHFDQYSTILWEKLSFCIYPKVIQLQNSNQFLNSSNSKRYKYNKCQQFLFDGNNDNAFTGIINYLHEKCGGNVHEKGVVIVTSSSVYLKHGRPEYAVDLKKENNYFQSNDDKNAWIQYDFVDMKVRPSHYSIRSRHEGKPKGDNNLVNWVIEGSNSGKENEWKILDNRSNVTCLDYLKAQNTFDINAHLEPNECFRYLRLRQTGKDSEQLYWLTFSALEYFGSLYTSE